MQTLMCRCALCTVGSRTRAGGTGEDLHLLWSRGPSVPGKLAAGEFVLQFLLAPERNF